MAIHHSMSGKGVAVVAKEGLPLLTLLSITGDRRCLRSRWSCRQRR